MISAHKRTLLASPARLAWATCLALSVMATGCTSLPMADSRPLYQQLGGTEALTRITDRTMDRVSTDPRTRRTFDGVKMTPLKASVANYVCKVADGPCTYEGETMARSHADLGITGAEFDLMVTMLRDELNAAGVSEGAKNELLKRLAPSRRDIVKP